MIVLQVIRDRYKDQEERLRGEVSANPTEDHIRRPTNGISLKEDTYATLRVVANEGNKSVNLIDAGSRRKLSNGGKDFLEEDGRRLTDVYSNFLLQAVSEERAEKQQIIETFGEPYIFLFGERARMMTFQGVLLNTEDFNWEAEWWENYDRYLRGTRCVEKDARVYIAFDDVLVGGYICGAASSKSAQERNHVPFQFQMFVTSYTNFSAIGNPHPNSAFASLDGTQAQFDAFRPVLLSTNDFPQGRIAGGRVQEPTLLEGLQGAGLREVINTWNRAQDIANNAIAKVGNFINGEVIRVPYGFQGALAFDEGDIVRLTPNSRNTISFNVNAAYSDNVHEYVGRSSHYGASGSSSGANRVTFEEVDPVKLQARDDRLDAEARKQWAKYGFEVPAEQSSLTSALLVRKTVGLFALGASTTWRLTKPQEASTEDLEYKNLLPSNGVQDVVEASPTSRAGGLPDIES